MQMASLFLIPVTLGDTPIDKVLPQYNKEIISTLNYFIVENVRTARRFLKKSNPDIDIDSLTFFVLNQHTHVEEISNSFGGAFFYLIITYGFRI